MDEVSAVRVSPCAVVPVILRLPVGSVFTFVTIKVEALVKVSDAPWPSVYDTRAEIVFPISEDVRMYVDVFAPEIAVSPAFQTIVRDPKPSSSTT